MESILESGAVPNAVGRWQPSLLALPSSGRAGLAHRCALVMRFPKAAET
jgi:hypothetical protein